MFSSTLGLVAFRRDVCLSFYLIFRFYNISMREVKEFIPSKSNAVEKRDDCMRKNRYYKLGNVI